MFISTRYLSALLVIGFAATFTPAADPPAPGSDPVDDALATLADAIVHHARDTMKVPNVGVISVPVAWGMGVPYPNTTELGTMLARRLEVALVLANPDDDLMILRRPGETVAANRDRVSSHVVSESRRKFFLHKYTPAWGDPEQRVEAAAFVVVTARVSPKLDELFLKTEMFDKHGAMTTVPKGMLHAKISPRVLAELGCGFRADPTGKGVTFSGARGVDPAVMKKNLPASTSSNTPGEQQTILAQPAELLRDAPVKFQIFYNDTEAPVESVGGYFRVRPPTKDETVHFVLTNPTEAPVGAVMKLNGENTIERQTLPDDRCRKWVIDPGKSVTIRGFLRANNKEWEKFQVLSEGESDAEAVKYGAHAGSFRLTVFAGKTVPSGNDPEPPAADETLASRLAIARGSVDVAGNKAGSLNALQRQLRAAAPADGRRGGLVVPGGEVETKSVDLVRFEMLSNTPILNLPVWYFDAGNRPKTSN